VAEAIGLDIGGTKIAGFRVRDDGHVLDRRTVRTPAQDSDATVDSTIAVAKELVAHDVRAVGIGAAGMVDHDDVVRYSPNLSYRNLAIGSRVGQALGLPCVADNDANAAAWGEFRVGAGRDVDDMLLVTIGTGIGGGIVSDGRLIHGANGFAGEIGHIIVEPGGPLCGCGNRGCWEQVASGTAVARNGRAAAAEHPTSLLAALADGDPDRVTGRTVTEAARRNDEVAIGILVEVGRRLGEGMAGLVNVIDPQLVVVGGGAAEAGELLLGPARSVFRQAVEAPEYRPDVPVRAAELGNDAGGIGAALLSLEAAAP
jgi:glucokinase